LLNGRIKKYKRRRNWVILEEELVEDNIFATDVLPSKEFFEKVLKSRKGGKRDEKNGKRGRNIQ